MADETEALRTEIAELRAEVDRLRAWQAGHSCSSQPQVRYWQPAGYLPPLNVCAANPAPAPAFVFGTTCGQPPTVITKMPTQGCADQGQASLYFTWPA